MAKVHTVSIPDMLVEARERGASDLHIVPGAPPTVRISGNLLPAGEKALAPEDTAYLIGGFLESIGREKEWERFLESRHELDFGAVVEGAGRVRGNCFFTCGAIAAAFRLIPADIPSFDELRLPPVIPTLIERPGGLLIVTGPTGHGKTTTQAAMVQEINRKHCRRIITIEDPVEYAFVNIRSVVSQREVGRDTPSFADGLRAALRQNPDVILVGEMRDLETMQTALNAAETGHLVITTLHTNYAAQAVNRIVDVFPPFQQPQVRSQLSEVLLAVIAQRLVPSIDTVSGRPELRGRVLACEILLGPMADFHPAGSAIREGKTHTLYTMMETGRDRGMQTMEMALAELVRTGLISQEAAYATAIRKDQLKTLLG